jgi:hypothetical protein
MDKENLRGGQGTLTFIHPILTDGFCKKQQTRISGQPRAEPKTL